jgi:hypothetical protein
MWTMLAPAVFVAAGDMQTGCNEGLFQASRWGHSRWVSVAPYWLWDRAYEWGFAVVDDFGGLVDVATFHK